MGGDGDWEDFGLTKSVLKRNEMLSLDSFKVGFKSLFRCRSTSLESTPCISSSHGLCLNFQPSSQNFIIYGGVWCN